MNNLNQTVNQPWAQEAINLSLLLQLMSVISPACPLKVATVQGWFSLSASEVVLDLGLFFPLVPTGFSTFCLFPLFFLPTLSTKVVNITTWHLKNQTTHHHQVVDLCHPPRLTSSWHPRPPRSWRKGPWRPKPDRLSATAWRCTQS